MALHKIGEEETFVEVIEQRALARPNHPAIRFLHTGDLNGKISQYTFSQLLTRCRAVGSVLNECGAYGYSAILLFPPSADFLVAYLSCMFAGVIGVPVYPPDPSRMHQSLKRLEAIMTKSGATIIVTTSDMKELSSGVFHLFPSFKTATWITVDSIPDSKAESYKKPHITKDTIAFLQYTSGSTSDPKGVMVTHDNLMENERHIYREFKHKFYDEYPEISAAGWLPQYHDMGLIGQILQLVYLGGYITFMSPLDFLKSPIRWIELLSVTKAYSGGGPNFGYDLVLRKVKDEELVSKKIDLSNWHNAFNGSEPVRARTLRRFNERFAKFGFGGHFTPCFGMAETTLMVTSSHGMPVYTFSKSALSDHRVVALANGGKAVADKKKKKEDDESEDDDDDDEDEEDEEDDSIELVGTGYICGPVTAAQNRIPDPIGWTVLIVDPATNAERPPDRVGEIWIQSSSVAKGYFREPEMTERAFCCYTADGRGPFLRTGDLGFVYDRHLFVSGRLKDMIIIHGHNVYPMDIERASEDASPHLRPGCSAAVSLTVSMKKILDNEEADKAGKKAESGKGKKKGKKAGGAEEIKAEETEEENITVVQEVRDTCPATEYPKLVELIVASVAKEVDVAVNRVVLLKQGSIYKTSSGKIQRSQVKELGLKMGKFKEDGAVVHEWVGTGSAEYGAGRLKGAHGLAGQKGKGSNDQYEFVTLPLPAIEWDEDEIQTSSASSSSSASDSAQLKVPKKESLCQFIRIVLANELEIGDPSIIEDNTNFSVIGVKSVEAVPLAGELEKVLKITVSPTVAYSYPSITELAPFLIDEVKKAISERNEDEAQQEAEAAEADADEEDTSASSASQSAYSEPIAVCGMALRFPGASSPKQFWQNLMRGVDSITEVPADRWSVEEYYDGTGETPTASGSGKMSTKWGGFIDGRSVCTFDYNFFSISAAEASRMDPQQRLALQCVWEALEDSGVVPSSLKGKNVGVYFGCTGSDYSSLQMKEVEMCDSYTGTGSALSILANRVSYSFGFVGPSMVVDTACSSSLVAVHLAMDAIRRGECSAAVAGGVSLILNPAVTVSMSHANFMSPDGRCKTFDSRANGYVRSEGCGVVFLKPLSRAVADGDRIYSVLLATAVNQDGKSNGLTAPSPLSQEMLLRQCLKDASHVRDENGARIVRSGSDIDYVECHGTGTKLGDPIEVEALATVYAKKLRATKSASSEPNPLRVGSVKTNIGHLEGAAGVASLVKVSLCLHNGMFVRSLHFQQPNPHIDFERLHVKVQDTNQVWSAKPRGDANNENCLRRVCALSAFGFGGTNAHAIVADCPPSLRKREVQNEPAAELAESELEEIPSRFILPLSARSSASLCALAHSYADTINRFASQAIRQATIAMKKNGSSDEASPFPAPSPSPPLLPSPTPSPSPSPSPSITPSLETSSSSSSRTDPEIPPAALSSILKFLRDLCYSAAQKREALAPYRATAVFSTHTEAIKELQEIAKSKTFSQTLSGVQPLPQAVLDEMKELSLSAGKKKGSASNNSEAVMSFVPNASTGPAFIFSGQGAQRPDMAFHLFKEEPVFRQSCLEIDRLIKKHLGGISILDFFAKDPSTVENQSAEQVSAAKPKEEEKEEEEEEQTQSKGKRERHVSQTPDSSESSHEQTTSKKKKSRRDDSPATPKKSSPKMNSPDTPKKKESASPSTPSKKQKRSQSTEASSPLVSSTTLPLPSHPLTLADTCIAQPALFTIQVSLCRLLREWGIIPSAVVGHSIGEIAAAHISGALSLEDAVKLVCHRGLAMQQAPKGVMRQLSSGGVELNGKKVEHLVKEWNRKEKGMEAEDSSAEEQSTQHHSKSSKKEGAKSKKHSESNTESLSVSASVDPNPDSVSVATINSEHTMVLSGDENSVGRCIEYIQNALRKEKAQQKKEQKDGSNGKEEEEGEKKSKAANANNSNDDDDEEPLTVQNVRVEYAFHSAAMQSILPSFVEHFPQITPLSHSSTPSAGNANGYSPAHFFSSYAIPFYSSTLCKKIEDPSKQLTVDYWAAQIRSCVRFGEALKTMIDDGHKAFVEVASQPVLNSAIQQNFQEWEKKKNEAKMSAAQDKRKGKNQMQKRQPVSAAFLSAASSPLFVVSTMKVKQDELSFIRRAIGRLFCAGFSINWDSPNVLMSQHASYCTLTPSYQWNGQFCWYNVDEESDDESEEDSDNEDSQRRHRRRGARLRPFAGFDPAEGSAGSPSLRKEKHWEDTTHPLLPKAAVDSSNFSATWKGLFDMHDIKPSSPNSPSPAISPIPALYTSQPTSFLLEHGLLGGSVLPGAAYVEMMLAVAARNAQITHPSQFTSKRGKASPLHLTSVTFNRMLTLGLQRQIRLKASYEESSSSVSSSSSDLPMGMGTVKIAARLRHPRSRGDAQNAAMLHKSAAANLPSHLWTTHASAVIIPEGADALDAAMSPAMHPGSVAGEGLAIPQLSASASSSASSSSLASLSSILSTLPLLGVDPSVSLSDVRKRCKASSLPAFALYTLFSRAGLNYGYHFQGVSSISFCRDEVLAVLDTTRAKQTPNAESFFIHPALLDASFHAVAALSLVFHDDKKSPKQAKKDQKGKGKKKVEEEEEDEEEEELNPCLYLPTKIESVQLFRSAFLEGVEEKELYVHVHSPQLTNIEGTQPPEEISADLSIVAVSSSSSSSPSDDSVTVKRKEVFASPVKPSAPQADSQMELICVLHNFTVRRATEQQMKQNVTDGWNSTIGQALYSLEWGEAQLGKQAENKKKDAPLSEALAPLHHEADDEKGVWLVFAEAESEDGINVAKQLQMMKKNGKVIVIRSNHVDPLSQASAAPPMKSKSKQRKQDSSAIQNVADAIADGKETQYTFKVGNQSSSIRVIYANPMRDESVREAIIAAMHDQSSAAPKSASASSSSSSSSSAPKTLPLLGVIYMWCLDLPHNPSLLISERDQATIFTKEQRESLDYSSLFEVVSSFTTNTPQRILKTITSLEAGIRKKPAPFMLVTRGLHSNEISNTSVVKKGTHQQSSWDEHESEVDDSSEEEEEEEEEEGSEDESSEQNKSLVKVNLKDIATTVQGMLWGLGRVVAREMSATFRVGLLDLPSRDSVSQLKIEKDQIAQSSDETVLREFLLIHPTSIATMAVQEKTRTEVEVAIAADGTRFSPRMYRVPASSPLQTPSPLHPPITISSPSSSASSSTSIHSQLFHSDGFYLVTGGLGGVALCVVEWLLANGAKRIVCSDIFSRTDRPEAAHRLEEVGVNYNTAHPHEKAIIEVIKCDLTQEYPVRKMIKNLLNDERFGCMRGVIHTAGLLRDSLFVEATKEDIDAVMQPKVLGLINIKAAIDGMKQKDRAKCEFVLMFSSIASLFGSVGQATYSAANAFFDSIAASSHQPYTSESSVPSSPLYLSLNLGPTNAGMFSSKRANNDLLPQLAKEGVLPLEISDALKVMERFVSEALTLKRGDYDISSDDQNEDIAIPLSLLPRSDGTVAPRMIHSQLVVCHVDWSRVGKTTQGMLRTDLALQTPGVSAKAVASPILPFLSAPSMVAHLVAPAKQVTLPSFSSGGKHILRIETSLKQADVEDNATQIAIKKGKANKESAKSSKDKEITFTHPVLNVRGASKLSESEIDVMQVLFDDEESGDEEIASAKVKVSKRSRSSQMKRKSHSHRSHRRSSGDSSDSDSDDDDDDSMMNADRMSDIIIDLLRQNVSDLPENLTDDLSLGDVGLDSNASISIASSLSSIVGFEVSAQALAKYDSIRSAAEDLSEKITGHPSGSSGHGKGKKGKKEKEYVMTEDLYVIEKLPEVVKETRRLDFMKSIVDNDMPYLRINDGVNDDETQMEGKDFINFTSYNYLSLSGDKRVQRFAQNAIARYGTSVSGSRVVGGTRIIHYQLERGLAWWVGAEDAILYVGGFMANESTIGHLMKESDLIVYDVLCHSSIIQGNKNSHSTTISFPHNNTEALDAILTENRTKHRKCLIVAEGVYSMDGDACRLPELIELKKKHHCLLFIDEAHSIGTMGKTGRGIGEHFGIDPSDVDLWMGTLSKSFASCGGYIAGKQELITFLRGTSPGFIYSAGMPPAQAGAALGALEVMKKEPWRVRKLQDNSLYFRDLLVERGFDVGDAIGVAVVPAIVHTSEETLRLAQAIHYRGIEASPYYAPAVEEGKARIRFFISASHTREQLKWAADVLKEEYDLILKRKAELAETGETTYTPATTRPRWVPRKKRVKRTIKWILFVVLLFLLIAAVAISVLDHDGKVIQPHHDLFHRKLIHGQHKA
ncbi:putative beta-ketoacyl synthase [Monocercomonoides exilis]|uniref:putative beta-ketoacyl synthase n=1 Tax=Monocercomonoides exilis TaxID=2049356 RepID=UPI00355A8737|nr:putative beta-ketoacyl synthase [Monocercomonoides exilis]|eukprot:MONOS_12310.1-p1 / transcript=MONOS_12310.1 / gene=MONOS_12310 / organism=Monocercomonoides_exilis_PA203 / gene_product=beta-ketoacyl synthase / transcript_product=beta-ketoacyl synthase / location=Mono_scaffold00674:5793-18651(+) / protein_length=4251 / sequence_SO=supercontig / SO=protein_coding / is_pseudo=false